MDDERRQEQASAYALGILPDYERLEFERAMEGDPQLKRLVADFHNALETVAVSLPKAAPRSELKSRILQQVGERSLNRQAVAPSETAPAPIVRYPAWIPWAAAAVFALASVALLFERATLRSREAQLVAELVRAEEAANFAQLRVARLESQITEQPQAIAVSLWNGVTQQGVLVVENLALPPPGKTYQLWVLDPSTQAPIDAGIFTTDAQGRGRIVFRPKASVNTAGQFAISLEDAGGVPSPQGPIVMVGPATTL